MTKKSLTIMAIPYADLSNFSLQFEQLISDINGTIESIKNTEESNNTYLSFAKQILKPAHELFIDILYKLSHKQLCLGEDDSVWHTELLDEIIEQGKFEFKENLPGADINHTKYAWTYALDRPIEYGVISKAQYKLLIDHQKHIIDDTIKSLGNNEHINSPKVEMELYNNLIDTIDLSNVLDSFDDYNLGDNRDKLVIVFYITEEEPFDDDY